MLLAPEYKLKVQIWIPVALAALHNFIHMHNAEEGDPPDDLDVDNHRNQGYDNNDDQNSTNVEEETTNHSADTRRLGIANYMWEDYQHVLQERHTSSDEEDDTANNDNLD